MRRRILILTEGDDVHAIAVAEALGLRGADVSLWAMSDFPMKAEETIHYRGGEEALQIRATNLEASDFGFDTVWRRRPAYTLDSTALNQADKQFADAECGMFRRSLLAVLAPAAFWVNSPEAAARAGSKVVQHAAAIEAGLKMPETLYTNSPREVRAFLRRKADRIVFKPFLPTVWQEGDNVWLPYTTVLSSQDIEDDAIRLAPGIFQELVPKAFEVRLTMIGRHAFAAQILSQATEKGRVDWRRAYDELCWEPMEVPASVRRMCIRLMQKLGIVFGCFDFIVTPDGEFVFLEVNEMGQFLFVERYCGLPVLDAFTSFLVQGSVDFDWSPGDVQVHYSDPTFEANVLKRAEDFARDHVTIPPRVAQEA